MQCPHVGRGLGWELRGSHVDRGRGQSQEGYLCEQV